MCKKKTQHRTPAEKKGNYDGVLWFASVSNTLIELWSQGIPCRSISEKPFKVLCSCCCSLKLPVPSFRCLILRGAGSSGLWTTRSYNSSQVMGTWNPTSRSTYIQQLTNLLRSDIDIISIWLKYHWCTTSSTEMSPSWGATSCSANHEIPRVHHWFRPWASRIQSTPSHP
jgi:hypothetical protein